MTKIIGTGALVIASMLAAVNPSAAKDRDDFRFENNHRFYRSVPQNQFRTRAFSGHERFEQLNRFSGSAYASGYQNGYQNGAQNAYQSGYQNGVQDGYRNGVQNGYYDQFGNWQPY